MRRYSAFTVIFIIGLHFSVSIAKQCTEQGKFPNDQENSCAEYTMCLIAGAGNFAQRNFRCPDGFIFNHAVSRCTNATGYQCETKYNCTHAGNFRNPFSENCTSYIACVEGFNDVITARSIDCPENYMFSSEENMCVNSTDVECNHEDRTSQINSGHLNTVSFYTVLNYVLFISMLRYQL